MDAPRSLVDYVRGMLPHTRDELSPEESALGIHLRGNSALYEALLGLIQPRIEGRANLPEPSDPLICKTMLAKDRELAWLLSRLEFVFNSPASQPADDDGEHLA